tara:strand:- start:850 stop:1056 length:207 start_codon:yes stop_codon:yes gene_type:complete
MIMNITMTSMISGITRTKNIPVNKSQIYNWKIAGVLIQNAMPDVSVTDREFIMTGITQEEWTETFNKE